MLRDITLGQYYPADSVIHKLDPRVKLFATLIYIISLFSFKGIAALPCGNRIFIWRDKAIESTVFLYGKRVESNHGVDDHHSVIQPVFNTG